MSGPVPPNTTSPPPVGASQVVSFGPLPTTVNVTTSNPDIDGFPIVPYEPFWTSAVRPADTAGATV